MDTDRSKRFTWNSDDIEILPPEMDKEKRKSIHEKMKLVTKSFEKAIQGMEKNKSYESYIGEIPSSIVGVFPKDGQYRFKDVYCSNRLAGNTVEKSLELTSKLITRSYRVNKVSVLKAVARELKKIQTQMKKRKLDGHGGCFQNAGAVEDIGKARDDEDKK